MTINKILIGLIGIAVLSGCKKDIVEPTNDTSNETTKTATYQVTFDLNWNSTDFPTDYPSNDHFSRLIGWSHNTSTDFFALGTTASQGIEDMAELGKTNPLDTEIADRIANGEGLDQVIGANLSSGVGQIIVELDVDENNPAITLVSMIAPSPDWYVGTIATNLLENGNFVTEKTVDAIMYDSGTDDGTTYNSANADSSPKQPISLITEAPLGDGTTSYVSIGSVTFVKM